MAIIRALLIGLAIGPLAAAADWTTDIALIKDMVVVDKAYIPALMIAKKGDAPHAQAAVEELASSWSDFDSKWQDAVNEEWREGFARIDTLVAEASKLASAPQDLKQAHTALDEIRHVLARLRKKEGIKYFVDFVTTVEDALDEVVPVVAHDKDKPMTSDELDIAEQGLVRAKEAWKVVTSTRIDKTVYRIDIYYMGDYSSTVAEAAMLLDQLTRDIRTDDRAVLAEKIDRLVDRVDHFLEILGSTPGS